jgi:hypothetical protein
MTTELIQWELDIKVACLEVERNEHPRFGGREPPRDFEMTQHQILLSIEEIVRNHTGHMKGLVQVSFTDIKSKKVPGLIR